MGSKFKCYDCDYECVLEMIDRTSPPDNCPVNGNDVEWIKHIVVKENNNEKQ